MILNLTNIKKLKQESSSQLTRHVCNYIILVWNDYSNKKNIFTDVLHYGCQAGTVGELIYYTDTVRFYKQYRSEINELLYDTMNGTGLLVLNMGSHLSVSWGQWFCHRAIGHNFETLKDCI